uniref:procollagen-proline 4-dioxygenase n=1 Tax=Kalanchoe fedtschenkoi TaxID=63787 RepID=A0A7N1A2U9_KALFE
MAKQKQQPRLKKSMLRHSTLFFALLFIFSLLLALTLFGVGFIFVPTDSGEATSITSIVRKTVVRENEGGGDEEDGRERWTEVLSWEPRAFVYHNFLTKAECEHLIDISKPHMQKSFVVDPKTGLPRASSARTSYGWFLRKGQDAFIRNIEKRIADLTFIPVENGESIQILRYETGQEYKFHHDYFSDKFSVQRGGQRVATVLIYLSDVEEGGETVFPRAKGDFSSVSRRNNSSVCAGTGLAVKPRMGDALLFWSMKPDGTPDPNSLHGGCPVINGTKWSATKWLRMSEYI